MRRGYVKYPKQVFVPCALKQTESLAREPSTTYKSLHTSPGKVKPNISWFLYAQYQLQILAAPVLQNVQTTDVSRKWIARGREVPQ